MALHPVTGCERGRREPGTPAGPRASFQEGQAADVRVPGHTSSAVKIWLLPSAAGLAVRGARRSWLRDLPRLGFAAPRGPRADPEPVAAVAIVPGRAFGTLPDAAVRPI